LFIQQRIISVQQQIIDDQNQEILRLQELVHSLSRESDEDSEPDYSSMEERARVQTPSGVNWRAVPRTTTYSELYEAQDGLDAEER
jgi:hypothetical protein